MFEDNRFAITEGTTRRIDYSLIRNKNQRCRVLYKVEDIATYLVKYREYDLAPLKLIFEFSIYNVWKSVQYDVSNGLDMAYWGFLRARIRRIFLMDTAYWSSE
ncbi:hypothetical protein Tco_1303975 [Tanacetum coccineum]